MRFGPYLPKVGSRFRHMTPRSYRTEHRPVYSGSSHQIHSQKIHLSKLPTHYDYPGHPPTFYWPRSSFSFSLFLLSFLFASFLSFPSSLPCSYIYLTILSSILYTTPTPESYTSVTPTTPTLSVPYTRLRTSYNLFWHLAWGISPIVFPES